METTQIAKIAGVAYDYFDRVARSSKIWSHRIDGQFAR